MATKNKIGRPGFFGEDETKIALFIRRRSEVWLKWGANFSLGTITDLIRFNFPDCPAVLSHPLPAENSGMEDNVRRAAYRLVLKYGIWFGEHPARKAASGAAHKGVKPWKRSKEQGKELAQ